MLRHDPLTHGRSVFEAKCLSCHYFDGKGQVSSDSKGQPVSTPQVASDLKDYGSYAWVRGLLENPSADAYFGKVPQCDGMAEWKKGSKLNKQQLDDVARFVASFAEIPADMTAEEWVNSPGSPITLAWRFSTKTAPSATSSLRGSVKGAIATRPSCSRGARRSGSVA